MSGFTGQSASNWIQEVRSRDPDWFDFSEEVNDFCHEILFQISPHKNIDLEVLSSILFKRILCAYQAIIILAERGMHTEALVQRRSLLEALFILGGIWQKPKLVADYVNADVHRRLNIYKNISDLNKDRRQALAPNLSDEGLKEIILNLEREAKNVKYISIKAFAQAAHLYDLYLFDYCILSEAVHHAIKDLERSIQVDVSNEIEQLIWGPEPEVPFNVLFPTIDQMLMATYVVAKIFKIKVKEKFKMFSERSRRLSEIAAAKGAANHASGAGRE